MPDLRGAEADCDAVGEELVSAPQEQPSLFDSPEERAARIGPAEAFDGRTYEPGADFARLKGQLGRVFRLMRDGRWRSLSAISAEIGDPEASVSARLRDLRKRKLGGYTVERRRADGYAPGLFEYRLALRASGEGEGPRSSGGPDGPGASTPGPEGLS